MLDPEILATTASEPLSLDEEHAMQASWRNDADKLTFIACLPLSTPSADAKGNGSVRAHVDDSPGQMIGDINLFITPAEEDDEGCIGEIELMIAQTQARRKGHGRGAVIAFMKYLSDHLDEILAEYAGSVLQEDGRKMKLLQLRVKIGSENVKSIGLFESLRFVRVGEGPNYFGEVELTFEGWLGKGRIEGLMEKQEVAWYQEMRYLKGSVEVQND